MSEAASIRVNFGKAIPLFPLDTAVLLPQQVIPLHIFEPRYRAMVGDVLDSSGQFAVAVYEGDAWKQNYHGNPPVRPMVCLAQIAEHEALPDGRYNLVIQGVCRAKILSHLPAEEGRLYRLAMLEPAIDDKAGEQELEDIRTWVTEMLEDGPLRHLAAAESVLAYVRNEEVPSVAVMELLGFALTTDPEHRYRLLAEPKASARAELLKADLGALGSLLQRAAAQRAEPWPKGCSWN